MFNGKIHYKWPFSIATSTFFTREYVEITFFVDQIQVLQVKHQPCLSMKLRCMSTCRNDTFPLGLFQKHPFDCWEIARWSNPRLLPYTYLPILTWQILVALCKRDVKLFGNSSLKMTQNQFKSTLRPFRSRLQYLGEPIHLWLY